MSETFFENKNCKYFPCHPRLNQHNCMFCYCPLYNFRNCGGNFVFLQNGIKDCSKCTLPHDKDGWNVITSILKSQPSYSNLSLEISYIYLIQKAHNANNRQRKHQIANLAKKRFPNQYKKEDFLKKRYADMSYDELKELYHKSKGKVCYYIKHIAKKRNAYNVKDFGISKIKKLESYNTLVKRYHRTCNCIYRGNTKYRAKKLYSEFFKEEHFKKDKL